MPLLRSSLDISSKAKPWLLTLILLGSCFVFFRLTYPEFLYSNYGRHIPSLALVWFIFDTIGRLGFAFRSGDQQRGKTYRRAFLDHSSSRSPVEPFVLLLLSLALNLSVLFQRWTDGPGGWFSMGGLLTLSDASGCLMGAKSMIEFGCLDPWTARRPMGVLFYAALMKITGQNLMQTYLLTTILVSFSFWVLAVSVLRTHGFSASLMTLALVSSYFIPYNGVFITEPPGLMLGSISIGLIWLGFSFKRIGYALLGLFIFGLALSVRAGAFFILPIIVLYTGWRFRTKKHTDPERKRTQTVSPANDESLAVHTSSSIRSGMTAFTGNFFGVLAIAALTVAFSLGSSPLLLKVVGPKKGYSYQGNFAYTLYGLSKGGKGWKSIYDEHPELFQGNLSEELLSKKIYEYAFDEIGRNSREFIATVATIWFDALRYPEDFFFPFYSGFNRKTFLALSVLAFISLLFFHDRRDRPLVFFVFLSLTGIVLSSPFLRLAPSPFFDEVTARVYAASMPLNCLAFGIGIGVFLKWVRSLSSQKSHPGDVEDTIQMASSVPTVFERSGVALAGVLMCLLIGMPLYLNLSHPEHSLENERFDCGQGTSMIFRAAKGSHLEIVEDCEITRVPKLGISSFRIDNPSLGGGPVRFGNLKPGMFLTMGLNLLNPEDLVYITLDQDPSKYDGELIAICGTRVVSSSPHHIYHGSVIKVIEAGANQL
ncbi:MAG: hypothetical protein CVU57_02080 [Deltaproteobacteria bacterium HGW-Deltaproteobacteria-15]|nr:MAG: hypothetical protein CVU57_02080 [Deltaproteobacteria bacterium HGW-Deltaproteobacteria-15]